MNIKYSIIRLVSLIIFITDNCILCHDICKKTSSCSCKFSDGDVIDLNQLAKNDNTPRFEDLDDPSSTADYYSWNPCQPFTEGDCSNVAVCNLHQNVPNPEFFPLGDQDSATFSTEGDVTKLTYLHLGTGGAQRSSEFTLTCDKSQEGAVIVTGENPVGSGQYFFELKTKYACRSSGLSVGSILLIILFSTIFLYLVVGVIIQIFVKKASGKDRLPNYTVWSSIPGLIKDGATFVVTRGKRQTYSSI